MTAGAQAGDQVLADLVLLVIATAAAIPVFVSGSRISRLDQDGNVLEQWSSFGNQDGQIYWGHAVAVSNAEEVFVGDVYHGMRVQKFVRGTPPCP